MIKKLFILSIAVLCFKISAQSAISGHVDLEKIAISNPKVYLTKISLNDMPYIAKTETIASTGINEEGYFEFNRNLINEKEAVYRLHLSNFDETQKDTTQIGRSFLFSNKDTIVFQKSDILFSEFANTNSADMEWQGLRAYELKLNAVEPHLKENLSDSYIASLKSYTKDSLETLIVKLIGIKQLENKNLLAKDVLKNTEYYLALLQDLKESDIERSDYLFLENKLAFLTTESTENKFQQSIVALLFLLLAVLGLLVLVFKLKGKKSRLSVHEADLSRQERNIQGLILKGKSNKEIANELFISLSTVKTHISNIYNKLRVSNRQELLHKYRN